MQVKCDKVLSKLANYNIAIVSNWIDIVFLNIPYIVDLIRLMLQVYSNRLRTAKYCLHILWVIHHLLRSDGLLSIKIYMIK